MHQGLRFRRHESQRAGITPSFGGSSPPADNRPHSGRLRGHKAATELVAEACSIDSTGGLGSGNQSPRRLLSARSGEDSGRGETDGNEAGIAEKEDSHDSLKNSSQELDFL